MNQLPKRYIFVDYNSLKRVKFSKLEKVCNKVFILIHHSEENIPFDLVLQAQRLGKRVKWISTEADDINGFNFHISFLMGAIHQKVDDSIEFAILSDDKSFDILVDFINDSGRNCLRIKTKKKKQKLEEENSNILEEEILEDTFLEDENNDDDDDSLPEPIRNFKTSG